MSYVTLEIYNRKTFLEITIAKNYLLTNLPMMTRWYRNESLLEYPCCLALDWSHYCNTLLEYQSRNTRNESVDAQITAIQTLQWGEINISQSFGIYYYLWHPSTLKNYENMYFSGWNNNNNKSGSFYAVWAFTNLGWAGHLAFVDWLSIFCPMLWWVYTKY